MPGAGAVEVSELVAVPRLVVAVMVDIAWEVDVTDIHVLEVLLLLLDEVLVVLTVWLFVNELVWEVAVKVDDVDVLEVVLVLCDAVLVVLVSLVELVVILLVLAVVLVLVLVLVLVVMLAVMLELLAVPVVLVALLVVVVGRAGPITNMS